MTTPTSATIVNALVAASCITVGAIAQNSTRAEKDEAQQQEMVRQAECDAISAAYGVDPWRGTAIDTLRRQLVEASSKSSQFSPQSDMAAENDDASEENDEEGSLDEVVSGEAATDEPLSDLRITDFNVLTNGVSFDFGLDAANSRDSTIEIFSTTNLVNREWHHEISDPVPAGVTNHTTTLAWDVSALPRSFFTFGWPIDSDGDGISDAWEEFIHGTNPYERDSDYDEIEDQQELIFGTNPLKEDSDGDGLWDGEEIDEFGTNPRLQDTDSDGLSDGVEVSLGTDPLNADSDGDWLTDGFEVGIGSDPLNADTDGDGVSDGEEHSTGRDIFMDESTFVYDGESSYDLIGTMRRVELGYDENSTGLEYENIEVDDVVARRSVAGIDMPWTVDDPFMYMLVGMKFKPRYSGYYTFQIAADDYAWVKVGNVTASAVWQTGDGEPTSGYFIAGQEYDIKVFHRNDGGPTYLTCLKFGEYCCKPITLKNELTNRVLIFETPYRNRNGGAERQGAYIKTDSNIVVCAGPMGGVLTIRTEGMNRLECIAGSEVDQRIVVLGPNEVFTLSGTYKGKSASRTEGDIKIRTILEVNGEEDPRVHEVSATAIEVELTGEYCANGGPDRHVFGPLEEFSLKVSPSLPSVYWSGLTVRLGAEQPNGSRSYEITNIDPNSLASCNVRVPIAAAVYRVTVNALGATMQIPYRVVWPNGTIGEAKRIATEEDWDGVLSGRNTTLQELWCGYVIEAVVLPQYVSFGNIRIKEGYSSAFHPRGTMVSVGEHNNAAGANKVVNIGNKNRWTDFVGKHSVSSIDGDWTGYCLWNIPIYWQPITDSTNSWTRPEFTTVRQEFKCRNPGVLSIEKFRCYGERDLNGITVLKSSQGDKK